MNFVHTGTIWDSSTKNHIDFLLKQSGKHLARLMKSKVQIFSCEAGLAVRWFMALLVYPLEFQHWQQSFQTLILTEQSEARTTGWTCAMYIMCARVNCTKVSSMTASVGKNMCMVMSRFSPLSSFIIMCSCQQSRNFHTMPIQQGPTNRSINHCL